MNATQQIVLASSQEHHHATAAARTKTPPARPVKPGRRSTSTSSSTSTSHPPPKHQQQQQQHALPFDRLSLQNTAPLMMPIEGCEKLFPQPRGGRNLCFLTEEEEEDFGNVKLEEDLKRLTRVSLFKSPSRSTSPPHPRKQQQQTTTSRTELQDETESTESTTESAYEDSDHDNSTNDNDNAKDDALESLWQTAQQSTDEQQKLQVYWNLCYPQGTATTSATNCTPTKTRSLLSSQSQEPTKSWYVRSFVRFIIVYFLLCIVHYVLCIVGCSLISNTLHCSHCYSTFEL